MTPNNAKRVTATNSGSIRRRLRRYLDALLGAPAPQPVPVPISVRRDQGAFRKPDE